VRTGGRGFSGGEAGSVRRPTATLKLYPPFPDPTFMCPCALAGSPTSKGTPCPGPGRRDENVGGSRPARYPPARGHVLRRAMVADSRPRGATGPHPRLRLARGAMHCPVTRGHSPPPQGRGSKAVGRGRAAPPLNTAQGSTYFPAARGHSSGRRLGPPAAAPLILGRVASASTFGRPGR